MTAGYTAINDTGNGATITFAGGFVADFKMLGEISQDGGEIEDSVNSNTEYKSFIPQDLADPGKLDAEFNFSTKASLPPLHTPQLVTITYPQRSNESAPATFVGTAFLTKRTLPQLQNGTIQTSKVSIRFDGKGTKPAFTPATPAS